MARSATLGDVTAWHPDLLDGYESLDLALPDAEPAAGEPDDVEMVATLVRRRPTTARRTAVLYVHGWNDYFFQTHLADHCAELGMDFYALDLRRYGRSLRQGQFPGFITDLDDYGVELGMAADLVAADHDRLVLMGHSTGGLVVSLWAEQNEDRVSGLILNSPWLDLQGSAMLRTLGWPVVNALGSNKPTSVLRLPDSGFYARTLHASLDGEWDYDLSLKSTPSPTMRVGWLRAVLQGHQRVAAGLRLQIPALVMCSTASEFSPRWDERLKTVDTVLDVEQIANRASKLSWHVTIVRFDQAMHDLVLSSAVVRAKVLEEISRWVAAYVPDPLPETLDA